MFKIIGAIQTKLTNIIHEAAKVENRSADIYHAERMTRNPTTWAQKVKEMIKISVLMISNKIRLTLSTTKIK